MDTTIPDSTDKPDGFDERLAAIAARLLRERKSREQAESALLRFLADEHWPALADQRAALVSGVVLEIVSAQTPGNKSRLAIELASKSTKQWMFYLVFPFLLLFFLWLGLHFWIALIVASIVNGAAVFCWIFYKARRFQNVPVDTLAGELVRIDVEEARRKRKRRVVFITAGIVLLVLAMFLAATNPRLDAFRAYADSKGYVFPSIRERNLIFVTLFRIQGISGESHVYLGAFNQFFELE